MTSIDLWLVRTSKNQISGPFTREQVCEMIQSGKLGLQDEVCQAARYWIYLHESEEVRNQLGVEVPKAAGNGAEEITQTQTRNTDTVTERIPLGSVLPELAENVSGAGEDHTAMLSNRALRQFQAKKSDESTAAPKLKKTSPNLVHPIGPLANGALPQRPGTPPHVHILGGKIERSSIWRVLVWILLVLSGFLVYLVLKLLKQY